MRHLSVIALLLSLCVFAGCARKLNVEVSALADPGERFGAGRLEGRRCAVLPAKGDVRPDDLQFREFAVQVAASLAQKGCTPARGLEDADVAVLLGYGIGESVVVEQQSYVVYHPWGRWSRRIPEFVPVTTSYVFTPCSLSLEARLVEKAAGAQLGKQIWKVEASHSGQRADLRLLFPWLLAAAKDYYGVDSGHGVLVRVRQEDLASLSVPENRLASP